MLKYKGGMREPLVVRAVDGQTKFNNEKQGFSILLTASLARLIGGTYVLVLLNICDWISIFPYQEISYESMDCR